MQKILIAGLFFYLNSLLYSKSQQLELLQILFKEAERYPDRDERELAGSDSYDYLFQNFAEYGLLTTEGKMRQFAFGQMVRQMYDDWLGNYDYKEVYPRSTSTDRMKVSLTAMLAGLYPTTKIPPFTSEVNWSPIPQYYNPIKNDFLLVARNPACGISKLGTDNLPIVKARMEPYRYFFEQIKAKTNLTEFKRVLFPKLYHYARSFVTRGLPYPNWCTPEDYIHLEELTKIHYDSLSATQASRKAFAGPIIDQILTNIRENQKNKRKLYIYAGNTVNIASFVGAHDAVGIPSIPDLGAALFIETIRGYDNQLYIRINYWSGPSGELLPVKLPYCEYECLLERYIQIMSPVIPNEQEKSCYTSENCNNSNSNTNNSNNNNNMNSNNMHGNNVYDNNVYGHNAYDINGNKVYDNNMYGNNVYDNNVYGTNVYDNNVYGHNAYDINGNKVYDNNMYGHNVYDNNVYGTNPYGGDIR